MAHQEIRMKTQQGSGIIVPQQLDDHQITLQAIRRHFNKQI